MDLSWFTPYLNWQQMPSTQSVEKLELEVEKNANICQSLQKIEKIAAWFVQLPLVIELPVYWAFQTISYTSKSNP